MFLRLLSVFMQGELGREREGTVLKLNGTEGPRAGWNLTYRTRRGLCVWGTFEVPVYQIQSYLFLPVSEKKSHVPATEV